MLKYFLYRVQEVDVWMDSVDESIKRILQKLSIAEDFEKEKSLFQVNTHTVFVFYNDILNY